MNRNLLGVIMLLCCAVLLGCAGKNYKAVGYSDGELGIQALAGPTGEETPITQPYVIKGKATVIGQWPDKPNLEVILEPNATIEVQTQPAPAAFGAGACPPAAARPMGAPRAPVVLDGGATVVRGR